MKTKARRERLSSSRAQLRLCFNCRIRYWLPLLLTAVSLLGQSPFECIEELALPKFPPLARSARISGLVEYTITFTPGAPAQLKLHPGAHPLLRSAVENALRETRFTATCPVGEIPLSFLFEYDPNDPFSELDVGKSVINPKGQFRIRASNRPIHFQPAHRADPGPNNALRFLAEGCSELGRVISTSKEAGNYLCEVLGVYGDHLEFQVRNLQPKGASGLLGNFRLSLRSLRVTPAEPTDIDSPILQKLRRAADQ